MGKQTVVLGRDEGETLKVMGVDLRFLALPDQTDRAWSLMEAVMPLGSGPPPHEHPWDEAYYVVDGEVDFTLGDASRRVRAGDFLYAPGGTVHAFRGASERPARVLVFDAPAAAEAFFRDVHREVETWPGDAPKVPVIGARHAMRFLPPQAG
jgi:quercetin dioxygenase-like cupin family protein